MNSDVQSPPMSSRLVIRFPSTTACGARRTRSWRRAREALWAKNPQMQEEGQALPATLSFRNKSVLRNARLAGRLCQKPCLLQSHEIGLDRPVLAMKRHRQAVALHRISVMESTKI